MSSKPGDTSIFPKNATGTAEGPAAIIDQRRSKLVEDAEQRLLVLNIPRDGGHDAAIRDAITVAISPGSKVAVMLDCEKCEGYKVGAADSIRVANTALRELGFDPKQMVAVLNANSSLTAKLMQSDDVRVKTIREDGDIDRALARLNQTGKELGK